MGRITAFVLGGAIGAAAALAFAPYTGEKMRALVAEKANAFAGEAKDFGAGFPGSAQDAYKAAFEKGGSFVKDASAKVKDVAGQSDEADPDELREKIEAARQRIAAQVMENAEKAKDNTDEIAEAMAEEAEEAEAVEAKHAAN